MRSNFSSVETCEFGGENDICESPGLLRFGSDTKVADGINQELVLVFYDDVTSECRHRLTAGLRCELSHVELAFGQETGGDSNSFPHEMWVGQQDTDSLVSLRGESPPAVGLVTRI